MTAPLTAELAEIRELLEAHSDEWHHGPYADIARQLLAETDHLAAGLAHARERIAALDNELALEQQINYDAATAHLYLQIERIEKREMAILEKGAAAEIDRDKARDDLAHARERIARLDTALRTVEWAGDNLYVYPVFCAACRRRRSQGHAANCPVGTALAAPVAEADEGRAT